MQGVCAEWTPFFYNHEICMVFVACAKKMLSDCLAVVKICLNLISNQGEL